MQTASDTIKIGVNLELSGRLAQYGYCCLEGIEIACDKINNEGGIAGKKLELKILDNTSKSSLAALTSLKLQEKEEVSCIIGPSTSALFKASLESGVSVVCITPGATADTLGKGKENFIRACYTDAIQGAALGRYAYLMRFEKVGFLIDLSNDYANGIGDAFEKSFGTFGGIISEKKYYNSSDRDFSSLLVAFDYSQMDALFVPAYYDQGGLIIKQMRKMGITLPILSGDSFDSPSLAEIAGRKEYLDNVFFTNHACYTQSLNLQSKYFVDEYQKRHAKVPSAYCALGFDSLLLAASALETSCYHGGNCNDSHCLLGKFHSIKDKPFATGTITIGKDGNAQKEPVLITFENGKQKLVDFEKQEDLR